jgi:hypothetical protein
MNVLPYIDSKNCHRLKSNQPVQHLLISFTREKPVDELLEGAKRLRDASDACVHDIIFFNVDLTPTDSKLPFEMFEKLHESNKQKMEAESSSPLSHGAPKVSADAVSLTDVSEPATASRYGSHSTIVNPGNRDSMYGYASLGAV